MAEKIKINEFFEGPNLENDGNRVTQRQITGMTKFTGYANAAYNHVRRNGIPRDYAGTGKLYKEMALKTNAGPINLEAVYALDAAISQTIWDVDIFSQLGIPTSTMNRRRFELKDYLVQSEEWPRFTTQYRNPIFLRMSEDSQFSNGIGMHLGISIPFTEIAESEGGLWSPRAILLQELAAKFGLQKSRRGFLGTDCQYSFGDDGNDASGYGITGVFNHANIQTFEAGALAALDDDVTANNDVNESILTALSDFKKVYQPHRKVLVTTSGIAGETLLEAHRDTYKQELDSTRIYKKWFATGIIQDWYVTDQLYNTTVDVTHQQMMLMCIGPALIHRKFVYPQQVLPMLNKMYPNDVLENHIFGDIIQVKKVDTTNNANPITVAADITSTTTGDFVPFGKFNIASWGSNMFNVD